MALKDNWTNLVDNESFIQAEDINEIASAVIGAEKNIEELAETTETLEKNLSQTYELLEEFTTEEELTSYTYRTSEHNRSPLKAALVRMEVEAGAGAGLINCDFRNGYTKLCQTSTDAIATAKRYYIFEAFKDYNKWTATRRGGSSIYQQVVYSWANAPVITEANIDCIQISAVTSGVPIPIGTKISIYGVEE